MEQMYSMGLTLHTIVVLLLIFAIVINMVFLYQADESKTYKRLRSITLLPFNSMLIAAAIFTGSIMMAAKHLEFNAENIIMIVVSILLISKEVRRSKALRHVDDDEISEFLFYKKFAFKIMVFELVVVVSISIWMWFFA